jgi:hypothetical protein
MGCNAVPLAGAVVARRSTHNPVRGGFFDTRARSASDEARRMRKRLRRDRVRSRSASDREPSGRSRSILGGFAIHCGVAWSMDLLSMLHKGSLQKLLHGSG